MQREREEQGRMLSGAKQAVRLSEAVDSGLAERLCVKTQVIEPAKCASKDIASELHGIGPYLRIDVQASENRRYSIINGPTLLGSHRVRSSQRVADSLSTP